MKKSVVPLTRDLIDIIDELQEFFNNSEKTFLWLNTKNPALGNIKPVVLLHLGKERRLWEVIRHLKDGNVQ